MPVWWMGGGRRRRCEKKVSWSIRRGGCKFDRDHAGDCKPGSGRAR